ncbi:hypothetical protein NE236_20910 [Actinoallomurus purpureus]|jgi:hypothetical protein|uniref:hypothetical protein n=1 Tax=Actinoallomurus purpureus TaxID=478114 RepID=UPI002093EE74|nr:hypothetical protein [Actinoallomurus purpureus]MCO6007442.1 hypothetical protein [Actinoallomurus purpureus]
MLKRIAVTAASAAVLAGGLTAATGTAQAGIQGSGYGVQRCHAHKVSHTKHWTCVTPGSYCPAAAHGHYGYAVKTSRKYRCVRYPNGRWRWKRA